MEERQGGNGMGSPLNEVVQQLRQLARSAGADGVSDGELLRRFLAQGEEDAFAALVQRHGPMVLGVCRRVLGNSHDAEDAFQATFLVFVRKARSIRQGERLGNWLYGVAFRTAQKARTTAVRRQRREQRIMAMTPSAPMEQRPNDLAPVVDEELSRLPEKYRLPLVLCDLQGRHRAEAAQQLAWPEGTLSSRLSRGRVLLSQRLARRGVVLGGATLTVTLSPELATAAVSSALLQSTVQAGMALAAGRAGVLVASTQVMTLMEGVLPSMFLSKLKIAAACVVCLAAAGTGLGMLALQGAPAGKTVEDGKPAQEKIQRLIEQLGSAEFAVRQKATSELEAMGESALPALRQVAKSKEDLETKSRAERLIARIEQKLAEALDSKWAELGAAKHAIKKRLMRVLAAKEALPDAEMVNAVYLLTVARSPSATEAAKCEKDLRAVASRQQAVLDLAWGLVKSREFNDDLAAANRKLLEFQKEVQDLRAQGDLAKQLALLNSDDMLKMIGEQAGRVLKGANAVTDRQLMDLVTLVTLSRLPKETDRDVALRHFEKLQNRRQALEDIIWAYTNSKEFVTPTN
jgi:RNA polymerase sigma factor (sigma-70 family)